MVKDITLEELGKQVEKRVKVTYRGYHLARSLGFSAQEAAVLQGYKEETIRRLANERATKATK